MPLKRYPSGDDFTGKREFVAPNNVAIKISEPLAGTAANGSAAADEEIFGASAGAGTSAGAAGAGPGGANAEDKPPAQDRETNLK